MLRMATNNCYRYSTIDGDEQRQGGTPGHHQLYDQMKRYDPLGKLVRQFSIGDVGERFGTPVVQWVERSACAG